MASTSLKQAQETLHLLGVPRLAEPFPPLPFDLVSRIIKEADGGRYTHKQRMDKVVTDINKVWDFIRGGCDNLLDECRVCELEEFGYFAPPEFRALWKPHPTPVPDAVYDIAPWGGTIQNVTMEACSNDTQPGPKYMISNPDPNAPPYSSVACDLRRNFVDCLEGTDMLANFPEEGEECLQYQFRNTELGKVRSIYE